MVTAKKFIYAEKFKGLPKLSDIVLEEEELPDLEDGQFLAEALYWSVDPYTRYYHSDFHLNTTMVGNQVAEVIASKNSDFPFGSIICGHFGWRTHTICDPTEHSSMAPYILPDFGSLPYSLGLGCLGRPGNTAYFGFLEVLHPKEGETVVVTAAAGAVGSLVGQIAKLKGCYVIGIAGSYEKCQWLENEMGFDKAINYKHGNVADELKEIAPQGVDCFFDNVGGELSSIVIDQMNEYGRIAVCGSISTSNDMEILVSPVQPALFSKQLLMEGFQVSRYADRWMEGITQMLEWIQEEKIKYHETVTEGFENLPQAFIEMLEGKNIGKTVVKA